jgi:hypothetical protein
METPLEGTVLENVVGTPLGEAQGARFLQKRARQPLGREGGVEVRARGEGKSRKGEIGDR